MSDHHNINYVEFLTDDIESTKDFFTRAFAWEFTDYGPDYISFSERGIAGGFFRSADTSPAAPGNVLVVLFSDDLDATQARVQVSGGEIIKPIFSFPGGRRFHFIEPGGNELAVWGDEED